MRNLVLFVVALAACGHGNPIGPDGDGGADASTADGSLPDGPTIDGSTPDGSSPDGGNGTESETDGTRLKARFQTTSVMGSDGSQSTQKVFVGWWDTLRTEQCYPGVASDGNTHCLPTSEAIGISTYFVDSQCANTVALQITSPPPCNTTAPPPPKYATQSNVVNNCSETTIIPLGNKLSPTNWYSKSGNTCSNLGAVPQGWVFYDASSAAVDPSSFVQMTETVTLAP